MQKVMAPDDIAALIAKANANPMPVHRCKNHHDYYGESCDTCERGKQMIEKGLFARCGEMGLASKYHRLRFEDYWQHHAGHKEVLRVARCFVAGDFKSLVLSGSSDSKRKNREGFGTGKTTIVATILYEFYLAGKGLGMYAQAPVISRAAKDVIDPTNKMSREQLVASYIKPPLLIIDELGSNDLTKPDTELFSEIIANRLEDDRATIIVTNKPKEYLERTLHKRVISRIIGAGSKTDSGTRLVFDWDDARMTRDAS